MLHIFTYIIVIYLTILPYSGTNCVLKKQKSAAFSTSSSSSGSGSEAVTQCGKDMGCIMFITKGSTKLPEFSACCASYFSFCFVERLSKGFSPRGGSVFISNQSIGLYIA